MKHILWNICFDTNITIRITGVNDQVQNNSTINDDPVKDSNDNIDDIEQTGVDDHNTETTGVGDHKPKGIEPEQNHHDTDVPQRSEIILNQGV